MSLIRGQEPLAQGVGVYFTPTAFDIAQPQINSIEARLSEPALHLARLALGKPKLSADELTILIHQGAEDAERVNQWNCISAAGLDDPDYYGEGLDRHALNPQHTIVVSAGDLTPESLEAGFVTGLRNASEQQLQESRMSGLAIGGLASISIYLGMALNQKLGAVVAGVMGAGAMVGQHIRHRRLKAKLENLEQRYEPGSLAFIIGVRPDLKP